MKNSKIEIIVDLSQVLSFDPVRVHPVFDDFSFENILVEPYVSKVTHQKLLRTTFIKSGVALNINWFLVPSGMSFFSAYHEVERFF